MGSNRAESNRVLLAEDDGFVREHVVGLLQEAGIETTTVKDGAAAIEALSEPFDAVLLDLDMPRATGLEVLQVANARSMKTPFIILSGAGEVADAVLALKQGAFDYITKPFDPDELLARVREACRVALLENENAELRAERSELSQPVDFVAEAEPSKALLERAKRCAGVDSTVLITGPSGTGKSKLARWIHQHSTRASGPFVMVNCGALPRELIESELFGHEKGAFTGATTARMGRFESAHNGTLFLDEIGELPLDLQPKLLNAIQERTISRIGSTNEVVVDARIIAATNRNLREAISQRQFREDLFFRLNVLSLELPGLATRRDDILPLVTHTLERLSARMGRNTPRLASDATTRLLGHTWPGNVRELENVIERALVFADGSTVEAEDLGRLSDTRGGPTQEELVGLSLSELEKQAILATLAHCGGNRAEAARLLGVSERTIYNRLKEYGQGELANVI